MREENRVLKKKYNESHSDARRFAKIMPDTFTDEQKEKLIKETEGQEKLLERWNTMDPEAEDLYA